MTTAQNNLYTVIDETRIMKVSADEAVKYNEGDMAYLDTTDGTVKALDSDANAANLVGVFRDTKPVAHHIMVSGQQFKDYASIFLKRGQVYRFKIKGAEAIADGDKVYFGGDAQTVTTVAGAMVNHVGVIVLRHEEGDIAHTTVVGEEVLVLLKDSVVFADVK